MSPFLAERLHVAPFRVTMAQGDAVPEALCQLIDAAASEVLLASDFIDNLTVLQSVEAATKRRVQVTVLVPNNGRNLNALRWLTDHGIPHRTARTPFRGTRVVVDRVYAAESSAPLLSRGEMAKEQVGLTVIKHRPTAEQFVQLIQSFSQH